MARERLFIIHGMGNDAVGLVGNITRPIAGAGGNILDLRQDVIHGLFTIYLVVDLSGGDMRIDAFRNMIKTISEDTGIRLEVEKYYPVARKPGKKNLLLILVGNDRAGIISSISQTLAKYQVNIEFAANIAREGVFLMELLTDIGSATLPLDNLTSVLRQTMKEMGIQTIVQSGDVFNKKKRVILFETVSGFMSKSFTRELLGQTGISLSDVRAAYHSSAPENVRKQAASLLDGIPFEVLNSIAQSISVTPGTSELLQTLKIMGYRIGLMSNVFTVFTDRLQPQLGLDYCFGATLTINDDTKTAAGTDESAGTQAAKAGAAIKSIIAQEKIDATDVTVLNDCGLDETPGIRLDFGLETMLELFNNKIITRENLIGILGCFGVPRIL
jgi:phosphoserine phosphatase